MVTPIYPINSLWAVIESVNWKETKHLPSTTLKRRLTAKYSIAQINEAETLAQNAVSALLNNYTEMLANEQIDVAVSRWGDDSLNDACWHVVGLGRAHYETVLADPRLLNDGAESFAYVWPGRDDNMWIEPDVPAVRKYACELMSSLVDATAPMAAELRGRLTAVYLENYREATAGLGDDVSPERGYNTDLYNSMYYWEGNPNCAEYANFLIDIYLWMLVPPSLNDVLTSTWGHEMMSPQSHKETRT